MAWKDKTLLASDGRNLFQGFIIVDGYQMGGVWSRDVAYYYSFAEPTDTDNESVRFNMPAEYGTGSMVADDLHARDELGTLYQIMSTPYRRYRAKAKVSIAPTSTLIVNSNTYLGMNHYSGFGYAFIPNDGFITIPFPLDEQGKFFVIRQRSPTKGLWYQFDTGCMYAEVSRPIGIGFYCEHDAVSGAGSWHLDVIRHLELESLKCVVTKTDAKHYMASDGSFEITFSGAFPWYKYKRMWDGVTGTIKNEGDKLTITNLAPGTYKVRVNDGYITSFDDLTWEHAVLGQYAEEVVVVIGPAGCTATISETHTNVTSTYASDGTVTAVGANGADPYRYQLKAVGGEYGPLQSSGLFTGLYSAVTYTVKVVDSIGCEASVDFYIAAPPCTLAAEYSKADVSTEEGHDGSITVEVTAGVAPYQYRINMGLWVTTNVFNGLAEGIYLIDVKDAWGCQIQFPVEIKGPSPYNNFYGNQHKSKVAIVFNQDSSQEKFWLNLGLEADKIWEASVIENEKKQKSELIATDFVKNEDIFYADFFRDVNTPNISSPQIPLIHGDELLSTALIVNIDCGATVYTTIRAVNCGYNISKGHQL